MGLVKSLLHATWFFQSPYEMDLLISSDAEVKLDISRTHALTTLDLNADMFRAAAPFMVYLQ